MSSPPSEFEHQLELFRTEAEGAVQFFFAWDAVHAVASKDKSVVRLLNESPLFWNTNLAALQAASLVALGRIFDADTNNFSVTRLLTFAHANLDIFSKEALAERKRKLSANADQWLPEYLAQAYVPTRDDFRALKRHVAVRRKVYEECYRPVRHQVLAHRGVATREQVGVLFSKIDLRENRKLLVFLRRLHETLWQLYFNGRKPTLQPARHSVQRMLELPSPNLRNATLQERLVHEVKAFLQRHSDGNA
jgi:AbiU2